MSLGPWGRDHRGIDQHRSFAQLGPTPPTAPQAPGSGDRQLPWEPPSTLSHHLSHRRRWHAPGRAPLRRSLDDRLAAGVGGGLARRTGIDVTIVRVALVLLMLGSGVGLVLYVGAWLLVPADGEDHSIASRALADRRGIMLVIALLPVMVLVQIAISALRIGYLGSFGWAVFVGGAGLLLVYRNASPAEQAWMRQAAQPLLATGATSRRWLALRLAAGLVLLGGAAALLVPRHHTLGTYGPVTGAVLVLGAVVVVFGPWWLRIARDLAAERQARVRAEERAEVASQVHDSVLQTLALIQRAADDPRRVAHLARTQERELRSWLFDGAGHTGLASVSAAVEQIARDVESDHGVMVENITVGDCPLDDRLEALVAAAREATVNAAKWSGAGQVSIYAEVEQQRVSVFVRDRGVGFEPAAVATDRQGIAGSIVERMRRHGGTAVVGSSPGQGTEIELTMPR